MQNLEGLKKSNNKLSFILSIIFVLFTCGINIYGYFNLPKQIATQISFTGEKVNKMATPIYLIVAFAMVVLITIFYLKSAKE